MTTKRILRLVSITKLPFLKTDHEYLLQYYSFFFSQQKLVGFVRR